MEIEILKDRFSPSFGAGLTVYRNVLVIPQSMIDARIIAIARTDFGLAPMPTGFEDLASESAKAPTNDSLSRGLAKLASSADLIITVKGK